MFKKFRKFLRELRKEEAAWDIHAMNEYSTWESLTEIGNINQTEGE